MDKISAIVIAKDSGKNIADCLESLKFCDEVIVIDSNSKDKTKEVSEKLGAKVFEINTDDFSQMRNLGFQKAINNWILYVDTDERVTKELRDNIKYQISRLPSSSGEATGGQANIKSDFSAFKIKRKNFYYGNHEWPYVEKLERLFKKDKLKEWYGKIHESPIIDGKVGTLDGFLLHYTHNNLSDMINKTIEWSKIEAELRFKNNHPKMTWWRFPRVMISVFFDSYIKQQGYKAGIVGLVESIYQSFSIFITYARLWEFQRNSK